MKKWVFFIGNIALISIAIVWTITYFQNRHIEDLNGADDFTLQTITDGNIEHMNVDAFGSEINTDKSSNITTCFSKKFTGVDEVFCRYCIGPHLTITINNLQVTQGNLRVVALLDEKIIHEFSLNEAEQTIDLKDLNGFVSIRIAGESACYQFDYSYFWKD